MPFTYNYLNKRQVSKPKNDTFKATASMILNTKTQDSQKEKIKEEDNDSPN